MRKYGRRDSVHSSFVALYRELGCRVLDLGDIGKGCPDVLVRCGSELALVEIKTPTGTLTADQQRFHADWPVTIVRTQQDVVIHVGHMRLRARD